MALAGLSCHSASIAAERTVSRRRLSIEMTINFCTASSVATPIFPSAAAALVAVVSS